MPPNRPSLTHNDSTSSIDPLADSLEYAPMSTPNKTTQRATFKPTSTGQAVKFNDVVLSTPTRPSSRKGNNSSAPKSHSQNESPWHIKVTVEAEREDGQGRVGRTTTTKIPLKGDDARGRGRGRRSAGNTASSRRRSGTPTPKKGRRRKSQTTLSTDEDRSYLDNELDNDISGPQDDIWMTESRGPTLLGLVDGYDTGKQGGKPRNKQSAFQISVDKDDQHIETRDVNEPAAERLSMRRAPLGVTTGNNTSGSRTQEPSVSSSAMTRRVHVLTTEEEEAQFTPAKKTPTKANDESDESETRIMHAGHTPCKLTMLPTPSSTLINDSGSQQSPRSSPQTSPERPWKPLEPWEDSGLQPLDEYLAQGRANGLLSSDPPTPCREFDTIMESEEFSMVSLNSIPSARQHLSSPPEVPETTASKAALSAGLQHPRVAQIAAEQPNLPSSPPSYTYADISSLREETPPLDNTTPSLPPLNPAAPAQHMRLTPRLAKVVRAGIALQGVLDTREKSPSLASPFSSPARTRSDSPAERSPKERLDDLFRGFAPATQRELRAGLRLGEELAKRQRETEAQRVADEVIAREPRESVAVLYPKLPPPEQPLEVPSPIHPGDERYDDMSWKYDTPGTLKMKDRQAEWARERQAVSQQINEADSNKVIVIDSDDPTPSQPDCHVDELELDQGDSSLQRHLQLQDDASQYEADIWQQEAFRSDPSEDEQRDVVPEKSPEEIPRPRRTKIPSPWRRGQGIVPSDDLSSDFTGMFSPDGSSNPPCRIRKETKSLGRTLDFSSLLNPKHGQNDTSELYKANEHIVSADSHRSPNIDRPSSSNQSELSDEDEATQLSLPGDASHESDKIETPTPAQPKGREVEQRKERQSFEQITVKQSQPVKKVKFVEKISHQVNEPDASANASNNSKNGVQAKPSSEVTIRQTWFGAVTSYLPVWGRAKDSNFDSKSIEPKESSSGSSKYTYPKAIFTNLPPHGLPHPTTPLPTHGEWTNSHYKYLLLLHNHSLAHPEDFSLPEDADRSLLCEIMEAGGHTRPINELQLAIIHRWKTTITEGNEAMGWSGDLEWDDWFILKGLFCVEIGQVNRREAKRHKLLEEQKQMQMQQQERSQQRSKGKGATKGLLAT